MSNNNSKEVGKRKKESKEILFKDSGMIPIICEREPNCTTIKCLKRKKFLMRDDMTFLQFKSILYKLLEIKEENALFILVRGISLMANDNLSIIYNKYKEKDNYLHLIYTSKEVWGY